jgi:hypothetical protein
MKMVIGVALLAGLTGAMMRPAPVDPEVARLRRHFATVLTELRERDVASLTAEQRAARALHIERLAVYATRGVFPKNTDFSGQYVPYFIDRAGTRCAMAHLIEESGSGDFVAAVARRMNNAYVGEIARDGELGDALSAWLAKNGLTEREAARIQPSYDGGGCCVIDPPPAPKPAVVATAYKVGSGTVIAAGMTSLFLNALGAERGTPHRTAGWVGVGTGLAALTLGGVALMEGEQYSTLGLLNVGVGAVATIAGVQAVLSNKSPSGVVADRKVAIAPLLTGAGRGGLVMRVDF